MAEANDQELAIDASPTDLTKEDVWDDSIITEAFERQQRMVEQALKSKKAAAATKNGSLNSEQDSLSSHSSSKVRKVICDPLPIHCGTLIPKFAIGDACRAVYSADGLEYEADIVQMFEDKDQCLVRYVGYENEEMQTLSSVKVSNGDQARIRQTKESQVASSQESDLLLQQMPSSPEPDITPVSSRSEVNKVISSIAEQEKKSAAAAASGTGGGDQGTATYGYKKKVRPVRDKLTNESIILPYRKLDTVTATAATATDPITAKASPAKVPSCGPTSSLPHSSICPPPLPPGLLSGRGSEEDDALASMLMSWYMSGYHTGFYEAMKKYNHK